MRTISLKVLTQSELVKVETNARTFGEFKTEVAHLEIDWSSSKLIDRASKASFEMDDAVLPATDAIMFVMPTKSKAGAYSYREAIKKVKELKEAGVPVPFNYTHATTAQLNDFIEKAEGFKEAVEGIKKEVEEENELLETITVKPGKYLLVVEGIAEEDMEEANLIDYTTLEDLEDEAQDIKSKL